MSVQSSFSAGSQGCCGPGQLGVCWKQEMGRAAAPPHLAGGSCRSQGLGESCAFLLSCQKALHLLLKHSADVNARDKYWQTPLHVAAANRATKCVEAIIPLLSTVNVADRTGRTALHHAVHSGHLEVGDVGSGTGAPRGSPPGSGLRRGQRGERQPCPPHLFSSSRW